MAVAGPGFLCERRGLRADERRFNTFAKNSVGGTWSVEEVVKVAADGKTVYTSSMVGLSSKIKDLALW